MVRKRNFRRFAADREGRREGWVKFRPNVTIPQGVQGAPTGDDKITLIAENVRPNSERCLIVASKTTIYRYNYAAGTWSTIGSGYSVNGKRWQTETINGWIILNNAVDLPCSFRVEDSAVVPLREMREVGIAAVRWICEYNGFLVCANVTEIKADQLASVMNSASPYGIVSVSKLNVIPYQVTWSEFGQPINWAPLFTLSQAASSATITLPFPSSVFVAGVTRVAVINGGPGGGTLGGDTANPDGILVTAVSGNVLTLAIPTTVGLSYPRSISVTRWTDISTIVGSADLQDDASDISGMRRLHKQLVIYRRGGLKKGAVYVGRYTGSNVTPFEFSQRYHGPNVPMFGDCIGVGHDYHLYPANGNFYTFDGVNPPAIHVPTSNASELFFTGLKATDDAWSADNVTTGELWFCRPTLTLAYDYIFDTVSEIDQEFCAAAFVQRPGWEDSWFVHANGAGALFTYGLVENAELNILTYLRDGATPVNTMTFGRWNMGDAFSEKDLRSYVLLLSSTQVDVPLRVNLYAGYSADASVLLLAEDIALPTKNGLIPTHYRANYFQDEIVVNSAVDADVQLIGRIFERAPINSKAVTRNA